MEKVHQRRERRRKQMLNAMALEEYGEHRRAGQLVACLIEDKKSESTNYRTWSCQHRTCVFCAPKYARRLSKKYIMKLLEITRNGYRLSFLTLTMPITFSISSDYYKWLFANFKKLIHRLLFKERVVGAVARIETEFNADFQGFNTHIHAILVYVRSIPQIKIVTAWKELIRIKLEYQPPNVPGCDGLPCVVWIEKIRRNSFRRVVKYLCKFRPFKDSYAFAQYHCAVSNFRLIRTYGVMRGRPASKKA